MPTPQQTPSSEFIQICPTSPWHRTLPSGQIEIKGEGIPLASDTGYYADRTVILKVWDEWGPLIRTWAAERGIPPLWVLAIIIIESRGKNYGINGAGAGGLMGMTIGAMKVSDKSATSDDIGDPEKNIAGGTGFMAYNATRYGMELPALSVAHNAGSVRCSDQTRCKSFDDAGYNFDGTSATNSWGAVEDCGKGHSSAYGRRAVEINNSAIEMGLDAGMGGGAATSLLLLCLGIGLGFYIANELELPKMLR